MKSIKGFEKFFESVVAAPQYERGTILIFANGEDHDDDFMKKISQKLGYEYIGRADGGGYIIKTPMGEEENAGKMFTEDYPEFFSGSERRDLRWEKSEETREELKFDIDNLIDNNFSYTDKRRFINKHEFNSDIDHIIDKLNNLKL